MEILVEDADAGVKRREVLCRYYPGIGWECRDRHIDRRSSQKVGKEEIIGMYVALDSYIKRDHDKEWKTWEDRIAVINDAVKNINGVTTEINIPPIANHSPSLQITWDGSKVKTNPTDLGDKLRHGSPSIEVVSWEKEKENTIRVTVFMLKPGQEKIVATRIKEELMAASA